MDLSTLKILWIESCEYFIETGIPRHSHDFFHFICVVEGVGDMTIEDKDYRMTSGNIFLVPPFAEHSFYARDNSPLKTLEIKFNLNNPESMSVIKSLPFHMNVKNYPINPILLTMLKESFEKQTMFSKIINLNFELLITYLLRCYEDSRKKSNFDKNSKEFSSELDAVISYIYENLSEDISLDELAKIAGFEKNYFLRKFKKRTKQTPMNFIKDKRIEKAKELLVYSDMNISQIAVATGFKTIHYFSKVFYEDTGVRPLNYRNENSIT